MTSRRPWHTNRIAVSVSESPDMSALGMRAEHLGTAVTQITRHVLALGLPVMYGGDLRMGGFSDLLLDIAPRHWRTASAGNTGVGLTICLAWPVHMQVPDDVLRHFEDEAHGVAEVRCLTLEGKLLRIEDRKKLPTAELTSCDWSIGLTAMREYMLSETSGRIVLGGRVTDYKGRMPGTAEEALITLRAKQPLFVLGGFGGCARDICESLGLFAESPTEPRGWPGRDHFSRFAVEDLNNGLTRRENALLTQTPHIDQAIVLILRGLRILGLAHDSVS